MYLPQSYTVADLTINWDSLYPTLNPQHLIYLYLYNIILCYICDEFILITMYNYYFDQKSCHITIERKRISKYLYFLEKDIG